MANASNRSTSVRGDVTCQRVKVIVFSGQGVELMEVIILPMGHITAKRADHSLRDEQ